MDYSLPGSSVHARQEYWSVLPFVSPDLPNPVIESVSPILQADALHLSHQGIPVLVINLLIFTFLPDSIVESCIFLRICQLLQRCPTCVGVCVCGCV